MERISSFEAHGPWLEKFLFSFANCRSCIRGNRKLKGEYNPVKKHVQVFGKIILTIGMCFLFAVIYIYS